MMKSSLCTLHPLTIRLLFLLSPKTLPIHWKALDSSCKANHSTLKSNTPIQTSGRCPRLSPYFGKQRWQRIRVVFMIHAALVIFLVAVYLGAVQALSLAVVSSVASA
jgi:hypothetical protein